MAVDYVSYSGKSNVGFNMKTNEDYILFNESDFGDCLFTSIADGSGAKNGTFRPSSIAVHQTETFLKRLYNKILSFCLIIPSFLWNRLFYLLMMF